MEILVFHYMPLCLGGKKGRTMNLRDIFLLKRSLILTSELCFHLGEPYDFPRETCCFYGEPSLSSRTLPFFPRKISSSPLRNHVLFSGKHVFFQRKLFYNLLLIESSLTRQLNDMDILLSSSFP